jgi:hypothetical protein
MALSLSTLQTEFRTRVFEGNHETFPAAGAAWAKAYRNYAKDALSCLGVSPAAPSLDAAEAVLGAALAGVFASSTDPVNTATNMDPPFVAFWLATLFPGQTAPPVAPPGIIGPALTALWVPVPAPPAPQNTDPAVAAQVHAAVFDTWTRTVVVSHAPTCAGPIT